MCNLPGKNVNGAVLTPVGVRAALFTRISDDTKERREIPLDVQCLDAHNGLCTRMDMELLINMSQVLLDCFFLERESLGNTKIRKAQTQER